MKSLLLAALCAAFPTATLAAELKPVSIALDWTLNTNHIGLVVARDRGLYEKAGLEVEILPYTDTTSTALLASGATDFAYMTSLGFLGARAGGAPITALWATMQHETGRLVYNSDNPDIQRPADLSGKIYAGFGTDWEKALIGTMIRTDGGEATWDTVTLNTGAYEALAQGQVDFTLEVATWEGVNATLVGRRQSSFAYADYGVPDMQNGYIGTTTTLLTQSPDTVAAFMGATRDGYAWAVAHPDEAAEMMLAEGGFPNPDLVRASMHTLVEGGYIDDGQNPVGSIDSKKFSAAVAFLADNGVLEVADGDARSADSDIQGWYDQGWMGE